MSDKKKRTISELMKSRSRSRFSSDGFDLLGEGERLVFEKKEKELLDAIPPKSPPPPSHKKVMVEQKGDELAPEEPMDDLAIATLAIEDPAMANVARMFYSGRVGVEGLSIAKSAIVRPAVVDVAVVDSAIGGGAIGGSAVVNLSIGESAIEKNTIEEGSIVKSSIDTSAVVGSSIGNSAIVEGGARKKTKTHTREYYRKGLKEVEQLRMEGEGSTQVDNYIFDSLLKTFKNPSLSIVYLYLWRRTIGMGAKKIEISYQVMAEAVGISKRTIQLLIKMLEDMKLIKVTKAGKTDVPEYRVLCPWRK